MTLDLGELQRKVRQLDNDTKATYDLLDGIAKTQRRMDTRLVSLERTVDGIATTQRRMDTRLGSLEKKIDTVDTKLSSKIDEVLELVRAAG